MERGRTFYTSNAGLKELRYEISEYLERKYELVYDPNHEITVTVGGVKGLILRCVQSLIQEMKSSLYSHVSFLMWHVLLWQVELL